MILITGGGGFIGLNLARELVDRDQTVLLVRRHSFQIPSFLSPYEGKQVIVAEGDLAEPATLYRFIKSYDIDSIIHAAVVHETSTGSSLYQAMKVNLQGTADILESARIFGLRRVTFLSSITVYMPRKDSLKILHEDDDLPASSSDWISGSKKAGEQICQLYIKEFNLSIAIVRPTQVWGPLYWTGRSPLKLMVENAIAGKPTDLTNMNVGIKSPYVYVRDCAKAICQVHLAPSLKNNIYNISDSESHSLEDFAQAIKEIIPGTEIRLAEMKSPAPAAAISMSIERLKEEMGYVPDYPLQRAVKTYIEWVRDGIYG